MLFVYLNYCCPGFTLLSLIVWALAGYSYRVNAKRSDDDPQKRNFSPAAIYLAPITWPLFLFGSISLFIIKALAYGVFLIVFTAALLVFRTSSVPWLENTTAWVGDKLLGANTFLIRMVFGQWEKITQPI
jgi:hypothetical protein